MQSFVAHLPILTTFVALTFAWVVGRRWQVRGGMHHLWWSIGLLTYGVGTAMEAWTTVAGWHPAVFKTWYITGALLGGAPLAQGTVYLLFRRAVADRMAAALVLVIVLAAVAATLSPVTMSLVEPHRLTGKVFSWTWVRAFSPFINTYAFIFLVGGAVLSAIRYARSMETRHRVVGNAAIALGALLPGIGGTATRFGHTEVLYVTELIGLLIIWYGYRHIVGRTVQASGERHY